MLPGAKQMVAGWRGSSGGESTLKQPGAVWCANVAAV